MNTRQIWDSWITPLAKNEEEARRERMTRVIYLMVGIGLAVISVVIPVFNFSVREPSYFPILIILSIDCLMLIGWLVQETVTFTKQVIVSFSNNHRCEPMTVGEAIPNLMSRHHPLEDCFSKTRNDE